MKILTIAVLDTFKGLAQAWYIKLIIAVLAFLFGGDRLVHVMYGALLVLMLLDLIAGIWRAAKTPNSTTPGKGSLSWRVGITSTLGKFAIYTIVLVAARMMEIIVSTALGADSLGQVSVKVAVIYLATQELVSIDEHLRAINGIGLGMLLERFRKLIGNHE